MTTAVCYQLVRMMKWVGSMIMIAWVVILTNIKTICSQNGIMIMSRPVVIMITNGYHYDYLFLWLGHVHRSLSVCMTTYIVTMTTCGVTVTTWMVPNWSIWWHLGLLTTSVTTPDYLWFSVWQLSLVFIGYCSDSTYITFMQIQYNWRKLFKIK